jgi:hypothetical protein
VERGDGGVVLGVSLMDIPAISCKLLLVISSDWMWVRFFSEESPHHPSPLTKNSKESNPQQH